MKFLFVLILTVAVALATPRDLLFAKTQWKQFKLLHNKTYETEEEHKLRFSIFLENLEKIEKHNEEYERGVVTWKMGITQFADWTSKEFLRFVNKYQMPPQPSNENIIVYEAPKDTKLAENLDWRSRGAVTSPKNQGSCGSCWSFSATGALEGILQIKTGSLISLSEENLIDCSYSYGNAGCNGGNMNLAFEYVRDYGIQSEAEYPYTLGAGSCHFNSARSIVNVESITNVRSGDEHSLASLVNRQPVSIGIDATDNLQLYSSGILVDRSCSSQSLNHGVLAVGYGSENNLDYWIVKNSWGTNWGERGYVRMVRNNGNRCGVATMASVPNLAI